MKNKKGFTLIELLAVIVILAIIALIVTPVISKIIENTKKQAFKQSVVGEIQSGEYYIAKHVLETNGLEITYPIEFTCNGTSCSHDEDNLAFQGTTPKGGKIIVESRKEVIAEYITDGKFCASGTKLNLQIAKSCSDIDTTAPIISGELDKSIIHLSIIEEESGVKGYCVNTTEDSSSCNWIDNTNKSIDHTLESAGTYYVFARDNKDNVSNRLEFTAEANNFCPYEEGHEFEFAYTGNIQEFVVPWDGLYKLEVWGARGGTPNGCGGAYGGYASGEITLTKDTVLYVVVGGRGSNGGVDLCGGWCGSSYSVDPGYNGTGSGWFNAVRSGIGSGSGSGGGATNIGTVNALLSNTTGQYVIGYGGGGGASAGGWNDSGNQEGPGCSRNGTNGSGWYGNDVTNGSTVTGTNEDAGRAKITLIEY